VEPEEKKRKIGMIFEHEEKTYRIRFLYEFQHSLRNITTICVLERVTDNEWVKVYLQAIECLPIDIARFSREIGRSKAVKKMYKWLLPGDEEFAQKFIQAYFNRKRG
jgi:hypothetical protein